MKTYNEFMSKAGLQESMAVHAYPIGGGKFKVHKVGSKVNPDHVKVGDVVSSSDLDDLSDAGHKVKETKKPVKEEIEDLEEKKDSLAAYNRRMGVNPDKAAKKEGQWSKQIKKQEKKLAKEDVEQFDEAEMSTNLHALIGKFVNHRLEAYKNYYKNPAKHDEHVAHLKKIRKQIEKHHGASGIKKAEDEGYKVIDHHQRDIGEEVVSEKLTDDAKKLIQTGLGSRTPGNEMRKTSKSAREFIKLAKTKKENLK